MRVDRLRLDDEQRDEAGGLAGSRAGADPVAGGGVGRGGGGDRSALDVRRRQPARSVLAARLS